MVIEVRTSHASSSVIPMDCRSNVILIFVYPTVEAYRSISPFFLISIHDEPEGHWSLDTMDGPQMIQSSSSSEESIDERHIYE